MTMTSTPTAMNPALTAHRNLSLFRHIILVASSVVAAIEFVFLCLAFSAYFDGEAGTYLFFLNILSAIVIWSTYVHIFRIDRTMQELSGARKRVWWLVAFALYFIGANIFMFVMDESHGALVAFLHAGEIIVGIMVLFEVTMTIKARKAFLGGEGVPVGSVRQMEEGSRM